MNNYFLNLQKNLEEKNKEIINVENNLQNILSQKEILEIQKEKTLKKQQEVDEKIKSSINNIDCEKEYSNVIQQIIKSLKECKTSGEIIFYSGKKHHTRILQHRLEKMGYSIQMMTYPRYSDYCIDWLLQEKIQK